MQASKSVTEVLITSINIILIIKDPEAGFCICSIIILLMVVGFRWNKLLCDHFQEHVLYYLVIRVIRYPLLILSDVAEYFVCLRCGFVSKDWALQRISETLYVVQFSTQRSKTYKLLKRLLLFGAANLMDSLGILAGLLWSKNFWKSFPSYFKGSWSLTRS